MHRRLSLLLVAFLLFPDAASAQDSERFYARLCSRVYRRFEGNDRTMLLVNRRIDNRFGFQCHRSSVTDIIPLSTMAIEMETSHPVDERTVLDPSLYTIRFTDPRNHAEKQGLRIESIRVAAPTIIQATLLDPLQAGRDTEVTFHGLPFASKSKYFGEVTMYAYRPFGANNSLPNVSPLTFKPLYSGAAHTDVQDLHAREIRNQRELQELLEEVESGYPLPPIDNALTIDFEKEIVLSVTTINSGSIQFAVESLQQNGSTIHVHTSNTSGCTVTQDEIAHYAIIAMPLVEDIVFNVHKPEKIYTQECPW